MTVVPASRTGLTTARGVRTPVRPDLHDDVLHKGLTNFGRIFIGAGPAREFRRAAELRTLRQAVELDHRAVDVKGKAVACLADPGNAPQGLIRRGAARVRDNMKAQRLQEFQRLDVRRELPPLGKLEVKDENVQPPLRRHGGIELAQAARCGIAWIGKQRACPPPRAPR